MVETKAQRKARELRQKDLETLRRFGFKRVTTRTAGTKEKGRTRSIQKAIQEQKTLGELSRAKTTQEAQKAITKLSKIDPIIAKKEAEKFNVQRQIELKREQRIKKQKAKKKIADFISLATGTARQSPNIKLLKSGFRSRLIRQSVFLPSLERKQLLELGRKISSRSRAEQIKAVQELKKLKDKEFTPGGKIESRPKPKTLTEKISRAKEKQLQKIQTAQKKGKPAEAIFRGTVVLGALGIGRGLSQAKDTLFSPIQAIKNLKSFAIELFKNPKKVIVDEFNRFAVDPVGVTAEYITFSKSVGLGVKVAKRSPVGRFVNEELFIRNQPKEIQKAVRSIIKSSKIQETINPFKVKNIKKVDFFEVKSLTKLEAQALKKALRNTDSVVFGSLASRTLSRRKTALPKDVDLATANINKFNNQFINNLPKRIRKNYLVKGEKVIRKSNKEALFDVKPLSRLFPDRSILTKRGFLPVSGYVSKFIRGKGSILPKRKKVIQVGNVEIPTQKIIKVEGIRIVGFGEQTTRKGLGTLQVLIEKNARRAKDPQAFVNSLQIQIDALKNSKPITKLGKLVKKRRIKKLQEALNILTSRSFIRLLEKKVSGLTKEFPILKKINVRKLKKTKKLSKRKLIKKTKKDIIKSETTKKKISKIKTKKQVKQIKRKKSKVPSRLPKSRISKLPSRLPKRRASKIPSKVPRRRISKVPSKVPKRRPSKLPSKLPIRPPSKIPSKPPSEIPSKVPSKVPSKLPSKLPSKVPSKLPLSLPRKIVKTKAGLRKVKKDKLKRGEKFSYNLKIKRAGRIKILKTKLPRNKAIKALVDTLDNSIARSGEIFLEGKTRKKDIKKISLKGFRAKRSKDPKVLAIVEKSKKALDTKRERKQIAKARRLKKRNRRKR